MFHRNTLVIPLVLLCACGGAPEPTATVNESGDVAKGSLADPHLVGRLPIALHTRPGGGSAGSGGGTSSSSGSGTGGGTSPSTTSPVIGGCSVFPADSPWNTRVDGLPVSAMSAAYMANMKADHILHADWGTWAEGYGIPWQTVNGAPGVAMTFAYADQSDPGPYPFPSTARIEGNGQAGDQHVVVLDSSTCTLYETYGSVLQADGSWQAQSGAKFNLGSGALRPDGWTSADAAGLPILPGLVRLAEVQAGAINHALRFTLNNTQNAYIHPATHAAGLSPTTYPPMGLRVRLRADYPVARFLGSGAGDPARDAAVRHVPRRQRERLVRQRRQRRRVGALHGRPLVGHVGDHRRRLRGRRHGVRLHRRAVSPRGARVRVRSGHAVALQLHHRPPARPAADPRPAPVRRAG